MNCLLSNAGIVSLAHSNSLEQKKNQAARLLRAFAESHGELDPVKIYFRSTNPMLNMFLQYSGLNQPDKSKLKGFHAINRTIIGLRWVYHEAGYDMNWDVKSNPN